MNYPELSTTKQQRRLFSTVGLSFFILAVLCSTLQIVAHLLASAIYPEYSQNPWLNLAVLTLPWYILAVPYTLIMLRMKTVGVPVKRKMKAFDLLCCFPVAVTLMYVGNITGLVINGIISAVTGSQPINSVESLIQSSGMGASFVFVVILAPIVEELLFRKFLIDAVYPFGECACVLLSGIMFGAFHGNFYQFFYAFLLGCLFAFVYCKTGKVIYTILLHMFINFMGSVIAPWILSLINIEAMQNGDISQLLTENPLGLLIYLGYSGLLMLMFVLGIVILILRRRKIRLDKGQITPNHSFITIVFNAGMILFFLSCAVMFVQNI